MRRGRLVRAVGAPLLPVRLVRPLSALVGWGAAVLGLGSVFACNMVVGGASLLAAGGAAIWASECNDHLKVTVWDRGAKTCEATVSASSDGATRTLRSCYFLALGEGSWQIQARLGERKASSVVTVPARSGGCPHRVRSVELTLPAR